MGIKNLTKETKETLSALSDSQLYHRCKKYGSNVRMWMRKFEGLLLEVFRRRLYKRRGFSSIHEFAGKLAGMSHGKVDRILQLSKKLEDKPRLREIFESGEVGYSKISRVAYIATPETDETWAGKVQNESQCALELSVRNEQEKNKQFNREGSVLTHTFEPEKFTKWNTISLQVSPETERQFLALKAAMEKECRETLSYGEVFARLLNNALPKFSAQSTINICPECVSRKAHEAAERGEISRYVPREIRDLVLAKQQYCCARPGCLHPPTELHHIGGFALYKSHDPYLLEYLCRKHHKEKHAQDECVEKHRRENLSAHASRSAHVQKYRRT